MNAIRTHRKGDIHPVIDDQQTACPGRQRSDLLRQTQIWPEWKIFLPQLDQANAARQRRPHNFHSGPAC